MNKDEEASKVQIVIGLVLLILFIGAIVYAVFSFYDPNKAVKHCLTTPSKQIKIENGTMLCCYGSVSEGADYQNWYGRCHTMTKGMVRKYGNATD